MIAKGGNITQRIVFDDDRRGMVGGLYETDTHEFFVCFANEAEQFNSRRFASLQDAMRCYREAAEEASVASPSEPWAHSLQEWAA